MEQGQDYINFLKSTYLSKSERNSKYSIRAFAKDIGISSSRVSELFNRKGRLSERIAKRIAGNLNLNPKEKKIFIALVLKEYSQSKLKQQEAIDYLDSLDRKDSFFSVNVDGFKLISDWYHFGILTVMELDEFDGSSVFLAKKLGINIETVKDALTRLLKLDFISFEKGIYFLNKEEGLTTTHDLFSPALRKSHKQSLNQGIEALESIPIELRDITSMMMAIDTKKLPEAKKMIKGFRRDLCQFLESDEKNSAYQLNIQLIPLNTNKEQ